MMKMVGLKLWIRQYLDMYIKTKTPQRGLKKTVIILVSMWAVIAYLYVRDADSQYNKEDVVAYCEANSATIFSSCIKSSKQSGLPMKKTSIYIVGLLLALTGFKAWTGESEDWDLERINEL